MSSVVVQFAFAETVLPSLEWVGYFLLFVKSRYDFSVVQPNISLVYQDHLT